MSDQPVDDQARLINELISAGLAVNVTRIESVARLPSRARLKSKSLPGRSPKATPEQSRLPDSRLEMDTDSNTSSKMLLMELEKRLNDWLDDNTSILTQAAITQKAADADYQGEITRLVESRWSPNVCWLVVVVDWEVGRFIVNCLGGDKDLESVPTVTGDACSASGVTCGQYVKWQWGAVGLQVVRTASSLVL
jgi:hypothetical protein